MNNYKIISPAPCGAFGSRLDELGKLLSDYLQTEKLAGRRLCYTKVFLSDIQNQLPQLSKTTFFRNTIEPAAHTVIQQPPANGAKAALLVATTDAEKLPLFQSMRLTEDEAEGHSAYRQTTMLFERYLNLARLRGYDMKTHLARTWIYVSDIDVNYADVVRARNDIFANHGLTTTTHFIASTGIEGRTDARHASVAIDFLTFPDIKEEDKYYLQALDHLNPTHEYGVAFERGTRLTHAGLHTYFISGTASIDNRGNVLYLGNVEKQTARLLENIGALLADGGATMKDVRYFIVYLRDFADYDAVERIMRMAYPGTPRIIVLAPVCRPQWLVEVECVAERPT